jgi:hypothetical protein
MDKDLDVVVIVLTEAQEDTLRGYLGEILATDNNQDIQDIYQMLAKGL